MFFDHPFFTIAIIIFTISLSCLIRIPLFSLIDFSNISNIYTYALIIFGTWLPIVYIIGLFNQIIFLYCYGTKKKINFSLTYVKEVITRDNAKVLLFFLILGFTLKWSGYLLMNILGSSKSNPTGGSPVPDGQPPNMDLPIRILHEPDNKKDISDQWWNLNPYNYFIMGDKVKQLQGDKVISPFNKNQFIAISVLEKNGFTKQGSSQSWALDKSNKNIVNKNILRSLKSTGIKKLEYVRVDEFNCVSLTYARNRCTAFITKLIGSKIPKGLLPTIQLDDSYTKYSVLRKQFELVEKYPNKEFEVKALMNGILNHYFRKEHGYLVASENKSGVGQIDFIVKVESGNELITGLCVELKAKKGDSWTKLLKQISNYADNDKFIENPFIMCVKGNEVSYFIFEQDFHTKMKFHLKGIAFDGLLGTYADSEGIKIVPQENVFFPQLRVFKLFSNNPLHEYNNHIHLKYYSTLERAPDIDEYRIKLCKGTSNPLHSLATIGTVESGTTNNVGLKLYINSAGKVIKGN
jgi:mRNA-degrading endonuclease HigB of HigAB toxin-antitoxin module